MRAHASVYGRRSVGLAASGRANKDGQSKILSDYDLRFDPQWEAQLAAICAAAGAPSVGLPTSSR